MFDISVDHGLTLGVSGGVRLSADVYTPKQPGRYPALLMRLPYGSAVASAPVYRHPAWYAANGFCVVVQDVRGTGKSEGAFDPFRQELADTLATIEWVRTLPRSNGRVGMYGFSYQGAIQLQAAAFGAPLDAIAPAMTATDLYGGWFFEGGVPLYAATTGWALQLAWISALHDGDDSRAAAIRRDMASFDALASSPPALPPSLHDVPFARDWFEHETLDGFWCEQHVKPAPGVPTLASAGWYDTFSHGTLAAWRELNGSSGEGAPRHLVAGPWTHMPWSRVAGGVDFGHEAISPVDDLQKAFFARHLAGREAPAPSPVAAFETGANQWRELTEWPPPAASTETFYLAGDGDAAGELGGMLTPYPASDTFDVFASEPLTPVPAIGGAAGRPAGCFDQSPIARRRDVLTYRSGPLEHDLVVAGAPVLHFTGAASGEDCDWIAILVEIKGDRLLNVSQGALRSRFRGGFAGPAPLAPEAETGFAVQLRDCFHRFSAGSSVGLLLAGSSFPQYGRNPGRVLPTANLGPSAYQQVVQYVVHGPRSRLELPAVPADSIQAWQPPVHAPGST